MSARSIFERLKPEHEGWKAVQRWIDDKEPESGVLDFKCQDRKATKPGFLCDEDRAKLAVALSGFANTDGGVLVFGVGTKKGDRRHPDRASSTCPIADVLAFAGDVERRVKEVVEPAIPGVEVLFVENSADPSSSVVAVYVPKSEGGPHRTGTNITGEVNSRYYMRTATDTVVMPHTQLAAMFNRTAQPRLRLVVASIKPRSPGHHEWVQVWIRNEGRGSAERPALELFYGQGFLSTVSQRPGWQTRSEDNSSGGGRFITSRSDDFVLYPSAESMIAAHEYTMPEHHKPGRVPFSVRIRGTLYAMNAQPVTIDETIELGPDIGPVVVPTVLGE